MAALSPKKKNRSQQLELPVFDRVQRRKIGLAEGRKHLVAGLFAGIGGLERGLSQAGHETLLLCENDPAATEVLSTRFSGVRLHGDVASLSYLPERTTLLAAGFPCQDLSQAGKAAGIKGSRSGLVGEIFRLLEKQAVPWVLLENVPFMLHLGRGSAMDFITGQFESLGYKWAYRVVDSRSFGLPQRRRRVFFLASRVGDPRAMLFADEFGEPEERSSTTPVACGFYWTEGIRGLGWAIDAVPTLKGGSTIGIPSAPAILLPSGNVVTPDLRDAERLQGFPAEWTKPAERVARQGVRWKLVGNAVTVPAAAWLGRRLVKPGAPIDFPIKALKQPGTWPTAAWNIGEGRVEVLASEWPVSRKYLSLEAFLRYKPTVLSAKATAGFLKRTSKSTLRFPSGFLDAVEAHLKRLNAGERGVSAIPRVKAEEQLASLPD